MAWLDTSSEEQRRVRELIALGAQAESRDELGIGQIRDALSEALFPGTSVAQTRARYYLFIPWTYRTGAARRGGSALKVWTDQQERRLIGTLKAANPGDNVGLIGGRAGVQLKVLPSGIYWSGMVRYGILTADKAADHLGLRMPAQPLDAGGGDPDSRVRGDWHPTLPPAPEGFPDAFEASLDLELAEATWLAERIVSTTERTLLAHLVDADEAVAETVSLPWSLPSSWQADSSATRLLRHAQLFSLGIRGAAFLYNLLIAQRYEEAGHTTVASPVEDYEELLDVWDSECSEALTLLRAWDLDDFWLTVLQLNPRIGLGTRAFVTTWLEAVVSRRSEGAATSETLCELVATRERRQKGPLSRLDNERLLATWAGKSGTLQLDYRWSTVRQLVNDLHEGRARAGA